MYALKVVILVFFMVISVNRRLFRYFGSYSGISVIPVILVNRRTHFFPTGKIRKNKMCVLSHQSLLSAMHIAEKKLYGSIHKFNFSRGIFFPFCNMGKKSHGIFRFFKIAYF